MRSKECIAMILAGGQGNRLGVLTRNLAKPAISFGGKYRIIDFALSNCTNSDIDTVGVLTQYRPLKLNSYIGSGQPWDLDRIDGGVFVLPPYVKVKGGEWYKGTANAIYQNIEFIEQYDPEYLLVLSADHIYKMDYSNIINYHRKKSSDATIAVIDVPFEDTSRFGIMNTKESGEIYEFEEKPKKAKSTKASMGVYVFNWKILKRYLIEDEKDIESDHDFGKNIISKMINNRQKLFAYPYTGYWKDVGTIQSLWEANMDMLESPPNLDLYDPARRIYCRDQGEPPHFIARDSCVKNCIIANGCIIHGHIEHSIISTGVYIDSGVVVRDSIIMPYARIGKNSNINNSIIGEGVRIEEDCEIGLQIKNSQANNHSGITVVSENLTIPCGTMVGKNVMLDEFAIKSIKEQNIFIKTEAQAI